MTATATSTAQALLERYWDLKIPVEPEGFAHHLGLTVETSDGPGLVSGYLDAEHLKIVVSRHECPERRRFSVARGLGHFCLGHGSTFGKASDTKRYSKIDTTKEIEVNQFAAELLMPAIAVKILVDQRGIKDAKALRELLGVTSQALNFRLQSLGYFL